MSLTADELNQYLDRLAQDAISSFANLFVLLKKDALDLFFLKYKYKTEQNMFNQSQLELIGERLNRKISLTDIKRFFMRIH